MGRNSVEALGNEKISKLLLKTSIPAILALVIQSLYNIIDTIYVGHAIGSLGIAAMTVIYPIQIVFIGVANLFSIGGAALISIALGKGSRYRANKIAGTIVTITFVSSVVLTLLGYLFNERICRLFGANDGVIHYAMDYTKVAFGGIIVTLFLLSFYALLRAEGKQKIVMVTTIVSVTLNVILAPIFLWGLKLGMIGVSLATLLSQAAVLGVVITYYIQGKTEVKLLKQFFTIDFFILYKSMTLGMSSFIQLMGNATVNIMVNYFAVKYGGSLGLASYGLAYRLVILLFMPILGFMQGGQPILGYAYGRKDFMRIRTALKFSYIYSIAMSTIFLAIVILFSKEIVLVFGNDEQLLQNTPKYLISLSIALPFIAFQTISAGYFQATGNVIMSNSITILRQFLVFLPTVIIFSVMWKMTGLALSYATSSIITFTIILAIMRYEYRHKLKKTGI